MNTPTNRDTTALDIARNLLESPEDGNAADFVTIGQLKALASSHIEACEAMEKINGVLNIDWDHPHRYGVRIDLEGDDVAVLRAALSCSAPPEDK